MTKRKLLVIISCLIWATTLFTQVSFSKRTVDSNFILAKKLQVIDIDGDRDLDIVGVANDTTGTPVHVAWWENDGSQSFSRNVISSTFPNARAVAAGDLDGDNDIDVVGGHIGSNCVIWWEQSGSNWIEHVISTATDSVYSVKIVDLDQDSDNDLLVCFAEVNVIRYYENDGAGNFTAHDVGNNFRGAVSVATGLINSDGFLDVVGGAFWNDEVRWWQNDGTPNNGGWISKLVQSNLDGVNFVNVADVNSDGYPDILSAIWLSEQILWWQNDGNGNFGSANTIVTGYTRARSVYGIDVDGDADTDIVGAADDLNTITWWENDGNQNFTRHDITNTFTYAYFATAGDLDGDGDVDIIASAQNANEVAWFENHIEDRQLIAGGDAPATNFWNGTVTIDFSTGTEDSVGVFFDQNSVPNSGSLGTGIHHLANRGFYTITTQKTGYNCTIEFHYGQVPLWSAIDNPAQLVMCYWDPAQSKWVEVGTQTVDAVNEKITVSGLTSQLVAFSHWTIGSRTSDNPLPVELIAFEASSTPYGIQLTWSTASEINNMGFELYRVESPDSQFVLLDDYLRNDNLIGAGNSQATRYYTYLDPSVKPHREYQYRLVDVDFNGNRTIVAELKTVYTLDTPPEPLGTVARFQLQQNYPNPFNGVTTIPITVTARSNFEGQIARLEIVDVAGRKVREFEIPINAPGEYVVHWDATDQYHQPVATGNYFYRLIFGREVQTRKLIYLK